MTILDTIDGAIRDAETSSDAMRWVPEDERAPKPQLTEWQREVIRQAFAEVGDRLRAHAEAMKPALEQLGGHLRDCAAKFTVWIEEIQPWIEAHEAARKRRHCDYRRRQLARRRRR